MSLNTILGNALDLVFPAKCIGCGQRGTELCTLCLSDAPSAERESAKWIFPVYDYRHPLIKKSLWLLKYSAKKRLAKVFAENIYGKMMEELSEFGVMENFREPILIPIPLSKKRYRERGLTKRN
jgi:predicted amidophosphoribosyltransferase